ncbi:unnamed protein product [Prorocentrum cordatum]|uniref:Uncharacterized protein n=1 Tax=Prorocentrum cordatum TaxID=2364126 RepID=A0ABN9QUJ3_9DINO|nr:unnamed protein product [Polarella glacialis]
MSGGRGAIGSVPCALVSFCGQSVPAGARRGQGHAGQVGASSGKSVVAISAPASSVVRPWTRHARAFFTHFTPRPFLSLPLCLLWEAWDSLSGHASGIVPLPLCLFLTPSSGVLVVVLLIFLLIILPPSPPPPPPFTERWFGWWEIALSQDLIGPLREVWVEVCIQSDKLLEADQSMPRNIDWKHVG